MWYMVLKIEVLILFPILNLPAKDPPPAHAAPEKTCEISGGGPSVRLAGMGVSHRSLQKRFGV